MGWQTQSSSIEKAAAGIFHDAAGPKQHENGEPGGQRIRKEDKQRLTRVLETPNCGWKANLAKGFLQYDSRAVKLL